MAISPPGDIVLDVVKAADPAAVETARARLASMASRASEATGFSVEQTARSFAREGTPGAAGAVPEAFAKFEAMVLQTFLQSMLPSDTSSVYGEGMAGEMWQSLLAEQLGATMAKRGGIGIADRILRDHYVTDEKTVPLQGVSSDPEKPALDEQRLLSTALIHEIQRRTAHALDEPVLHPAATTAPQE